MILNAVFRPGKAWWNVLRAGFETLSKCRISTWQGRGKGRKVHRRVSCPRETCLAQVRKPSKFLNTIFDLAKRWQRAKAARKGFGALVERASRRF